MEIEGRIIQALEPRGGMSARTGNEWKSQEFVIETHDQYPRKCVFTVFGVDRLQQFNIQVGDELRVSFDIDAHDWNGRWFNDIRAWRVERIDPAAAGAPQAQPQGSPFPPANDAQVAPFPPAPQAQAAAPAAEGSTDDLPF